MVYTTKCCLFVQWAVNLQHILPRMEVLCVGERKTACVTIDLPGREALFNCCSPHWLTTHHHHRFLIISLTNALCSPARGCLLLGQNSRRAPRDSLQRLPCREKPRPNQIKHQWGYIIQESVIS